MTESPVRVKRTPRGYRVECRRCYNVNQRGWKRPFVFVDTVAEVGRWVDEHQCSAFHTVGEAGAETRRLNGRHGTKAEERDALRAKFEMDQKHAAVRHVEVLMQGLIEHHISCARCGSLFPDSAHGRNSPNNETHIELITLCAEHGEPTDQDYASPIYSEIRLPY